MKNLFLIIKYSKPIILFYFLFLNSCTGLGLREQIIIRGLPEIYRNHTNGFVLSPTQHDIDEAIALGKNSTNNDSVQYAYIIKKSLGLIDSSDIYVRILSPLYLIATHSREQAREYKDIDSNFIEYCKGLDAVKLSVTQQHYDANYQGYSFQREVILLRDGIRIEPLSQLISYNGLNPFAKTELDKNIQAIMKETQKMVQLITPLMTPQQVKDLEQTYRAMGYSEAQIRTYIDVINKYSTQPETIQKQGSSTTINLFESDNIYKESDLKKQGKYEIVFRTPTTNNLIVSIVSGNDDEIRFPVSFDKFR